MLAPVRNLYQLLSLCVPDSGRSLVDSRSSGFELLSDLLVKHELLLVSALPERWLAVQANLLHQALVS